MSINNSYFSKNNTILSNSYTNTGRNPVVELSFGSSSGVYVSGSTNSSGDYTRFIFNLDLTLLQEKINDGTINPNNILSHKLRMTNTSSFENDLLNTYFPNGKMRATSFDLILFRIPYINNNTNTPQNWDEGVGYDYTDINDGVPGDRNYSNRPSNWIQRNTISGWTNDGIYSNTNSGTYNYNNLQIIDTQHFEFGNENIEFDMTTEISLVLNNILPNISGWGIAYKPQYETLTGLTESYSVGFFTRHTQTFYEPYLETTYDDLIDDDRNLFAQGKTNKLYLYAFEDGNPLNFDSLPYVNIIDQNGNYVNGLQNLSTIQKTQGVYEVTIPAFTGYSKPCTFQDEWTGLTLNGFALSNITNEFVLYPQSKSLTIGTSSNEPSLYGFDFYGIKQDEKIFNTDLRKVGVIVKKAFSTQILLNKVLAYYRVYVKEGQTEVQVQDWTEINKTPTEYYFIFDTRDKIPNEYFIDIKVLSSGQVNTYKKQIKFQIVNYK